MPNHIYNVKQAAKILGLSTNTTYKYLNEGRIKATRGRLRGTFIITTKSLETFLGCKLPDNPTEAPETATPTTVNENTETLITVSPPTLATKIIRILITLALLLTIGDITLNPNTSPFVHLTRIIFIVIVFLITYQFGGFIKK